MIQTFNAMTFVTANCVPRPGRPVRKQFNPSQRRLVGALMIVVLGVSIGLQIPFAADACTRELPAEINALSGRVPTEALAIGIESGETQLPTLANVIQTSVEDAVCDLTRLVRQYPLQALRMGLTPA